MHLLRLKRQEVLHHGNEELLSAPAAHAYEWRQRMQSEETDEWREQQEGTNNFT